MKRRKSTKPQRIDPKFEEELKKCARERVMRGLADLNPKDISMREMTSLMTRTQSWPTLIQELKLKPKREKLFK